MKSIAAALALFAMATVALSVYAKQPRSAEAKTHFRNTQHCPATGLPNGKCPGYVIDHIKPLACGGADAPANMQWQTVAEAKAKDKWERKGR
jgi:5-methylcytosine-specific restriction endonuclease McrA